MLTIFPLITIYHTEKEYFETNMRAKIGNIVGEIIKIDHSESDLVGFFSLHNQHGDTKNSWVE